jgi:hypothetical protein
MEQAEWDSSRWEEVKVRKTKKGRESRHDKHPSGAAAVFQERARLLLRDFGEDPGFLEQWMAHYLAELLARAEEQGAPAAERAVTRSEIARLVPQLWELREKHQVRELRQRVNDERMPAGLRDPKLIPILRDILAHPSRPVPEKPSALLLLEALNAVEHLVLELLWLVQLSKVASGRREIQPDSFLRYDAEAAELRKRLGEVLPDFDLADLRNWSALAGLASRAIESMSLARLRVLGFEFPGGKRAKARGTASRGT